MFTELLRAIKVTLVLAVLLCGIYPAIVWVAGNVFFHDKASGGIVYRDGKPVGAKLIGQAFGKPEYFQSRPLAAGQNGYDAASSSGSNLGPTNKRLVDRIQSDIDRFLKENPTVSKGQIPVDLVTASGSGLDPHISPEAAEIQVARVSQARGLSREKVEELVREYTEGPQWGIFGEATVDLLALNLELDAVAPRQARYQSDL